MSYNPKIWLALIFDVYSRYVVRALFPIMVFFIAYSLTVTYLTQTYFPTLQIKGFITLHSLLGIVLGLFLVFRTNTAYDRWWEGRKIWGCLVNDSRSLAIKVFAFLPDKTDHVFFSQAIYSFVYALKSHLRKVPLIREVGFADPALLKRLKNSRHKPACISKFMYERTHQLYATKQISGEQLIVLDKELKSLIDHLGACERITNTPIPHSYSMFIKKFIMLYGLTLPFAFVGVMGYWSAGVVFFVLYFLISIELIAEEIEEPFGLDINDLPLERLSFTIKANVQEILEDTHLRKPYAGKANADKTVLDPKENPRRLIPRTLLQRAIRALAEGD